jgi:hypothetical protein
MKNKDQITEKELEQILSLSKLTIDNPHFEDNLEKKIQALKNIQQNKSKGLNRISLISYTIGLLSGLAFATTLYRSDIEILTLSPSLINSILVVLLLFAGTRIVFLKRNSHSTAFNHL